MVNDPGTGPQSPQILPADPDAGSEAVSDAPTAPTAATAATSSKRSSRRRVDLTQSESALVDKTRAQIRELVDEVHQLSKGSVNAEEFYEGFLTRIVTALASVGGAIWTIDAENKAIDLQVHINLKQTSLGDDEEARNRHSLLVRRLCETGEPALIPPGAGSKNQAGENPTSQLLVIAPLRVDGEVVGLVEVFQRAGAGPTTQRGYLRFVLQMSEIASEFLSNLRLRSYQKQEKIWHRLEQFVQSVHAGLDTTETAYAIANEGRRLIGCDRVSVGLMQGSRCHIKAVSGLDSIERRSEQVKTLSRLATAVVKTRRELWFDGQSADLPPQLEKRVHDHVDRSHARMLVVLPLLETVEGDEGDEGLSRNRKPVGAIVIEQLAESDSTRELKASAELVVQHSEVSLTNCLDHQSIFLLPLWKAIGALTGQFRGRKLVRTALVAAAVAGVVAFLCLFPYPFSLGANGALVPEQKHEIYAPIDGILTAVNVSDAGNTVVQQGDLLAQLASSRLDLEIENLRGQISQARQERDDSGHRKATARTPEDKAAYSFQYDRAEQNFKNLTRELDHLLLEQSKLEVRAPIDGQVVNWQVRQNLMRRPVRFGQHLMTVVPPDTQWLLELEMPERRLAHLARELKASDSGLKVTFALLSWPGREFEGELISVDQKLDVYSEEGNCALVRVAFLNSEVPAELLKSGTRARAKVHCGSASIGYSMFYELIETVKSRWQFWF